MPSRSRVYVAGSATLRAATCATPEAASPDIPTIITGSSRRKLYDILPAFCCSSVNDALKSKLKSVPFDDAHGNVHPIRCLYPCSFSSGARDTAQSITSWLARCSWNPSKPSATAEHEVQPAL